MKKTMKPWVALFGMLLFAAVVRSETSFTKKISDIGSLEGTIRTHDGGYIFSINDNKKNRVVLRKIDALGKKVWQRQLVGSDQEQMEARGLGLAADGGIFLTITHPPYYFGQPAVEVLKLDADGRIEWNRRFLEVPGSDFGAWVRFDSIAGTADGGAVAAGGVCIFICEWFDGPVVAKFSSTGETEWLKSFGDFRVTMVNVTTLSDGGFMVGSAGFDFNKAPDLLKLNASGEVEWAKSFEKDNWYPEIQAAPDGGAILIYSSPYTDPQGQLLWVKVDSTGKVVWKKGVAFENLAIDSARLAGGLSSDGSYVLFGSAGRNNNTFLAKADTGGNVQSVTILNENSFGKVAAIYPNVDGTVLFGSLKGLDRDLFFSGLDSSGRLSRCSLSNSTARPIETPFGKLRSKTLYLTAHAFSLKSGNSNIESKPLKKRAKRFCP